MMSSAPKYDGSPCGRCGLTLRYDSGACINGPCNRMIENAKEKISVLASAIEYLRKHNG